MRDGGVSAAAAEVSQAQASLRPYRQIWNIAWPVSVATSTITLLTLVNLFWIGHLGTAGVAAVSLCAQILFIVFSISNIVHAGTLAVVSRRVGEGDPGRAFTATVHGVCLGAVLGLVVAAAGYASAPALLSFFGASSDVETIALSYLRIMYFGQPPMFVFAALGASFQASGDTRTVMVMNVAIVVLNAIADPFLIFGPGEVTFAGVPLGWLGWGVDGAAIAASVSTGVGCVLLVGLSLLRGRPFPWPSDGRFAFALADFKQVARIGTPASVSMLARPVSTFLLLKIIASFGTAAIAAFGIAMRSFSANWIPYSGLNIAIASLVGKSLGAKNVAEARRIVRRGVNITVFVGAFFCVLYYFFARDIILAFDHEPAVVEAGEWFLKLIALSFVFSGPMLPLSSAMNGAGDTKPPMVIAFLANWPVKLPLCWALALPLGYGIEGVWIGMFVSIVFEAAAMYWWYSRGKWLTKKV